MGKEGNVRRVYPGGNTYKGFYSFYDYILDQQSAKRIIVIKGGPGVGKSSFMKKLGADMLDKGFDVEYHHCSSDNNSVDGVVFPAVGVALIDGTAPHVVDPKNPGGVDEIIHLGDYWDEEAMMKSKDLIIKDNTEVGRLFRRAYGFLAGAKGIYDNIKKNLDEATDFARVNMVAGELINDIFTDRKYSDSLGKERHLFSSAITPDGIKDHLETLIEPNERVYVLKGKYDIGKSEILDKVAKLAIEKGHDVEVFHNHFIPEQIDNVVIKDMKVAVTTSDRFENVKKVYDLDQCLNHGLIKVREEELISDKEKFDELINLAVKNVGRAKKLHDHMERYYIPNMDFEAIDFLRENTLERILCWAEEK
ncbi:PRK06851 family protein [Wukongibacter baidiensis]|uniref:PRK06851 family protein n=1 Tax=Wukongibacter baidiensis TaxID=1723361 RepID=UPI003D7FA627